MPDMISEINKRERERGTGEKGKSSQASSSPIESIRIEPAEGGWTVHCCYKPEEGKKGKGEGYPMSYSPPKPMVFTDKDKMMKHVGNLL